MSAARFDFVSFVAVVAFDPSAIIVKADYPFFHDPPFFTGAGVFNMAGRAVGAVRINLFVY